MKFGLFKTFRYTPNISGKDCNGKISHKPTRKKVVKVQEGRHIKT